MTIYNRNEYKENLGNRRPHRKGKSRLLGPTRLTHESIIDFILPFYMQEFNSPTFIYSSQVYSAGDGRPVKGFCDRMPLDRISIYERAIPTSIKPELLQSLLSKDGLTNESKIEPENYLKEKAILIIQNNKKNHE
ncbi:hypothetical protein ACHQM5_003912 [Ranunculus cassubicifolius]